jgi:hypothetical protein
VVWAGAAAAPRMRKTTRAPPAAHAGRSREPSAAPTGSSVASGSWIETN